MNYVGIDWAYGRAAWCAVSEGGQIVAEGLIPADEDGLARLVLRLGTEVKACVEMMSGALWVKDQLELAGWSVEVAHARKVRDIAPLACKTDKVDARVLAELSRRELVPALWVPTIEDRAIRERLRRRAHLVKLRTSARKPDLRPADPVRAQGLLHPTSAPRRDRAARAPRGAGRVARLDRRASRSDRRAGPQDRTDRPRACPARTFRLACPAASDDPRRRAADRSHLRRRDRRTSRALPRPQSWSATRAWRRGSASRASARRPGGYRRPAHALFAGRRSRPQTRPGGRPIPSTSTTAGSPLATERTRPSRRWRASC
jgi:Transposase